MVGDKIRKRAGLQRFTRLSVEVLEDRRLLSVLLSDSFNRANAGPANLGMADLCSAAAEATTIRRCSQRGATPPIRWARDINSNALQNFSQDYGGVELTAYSDAATKPADR